MFPYTAEKAPTPLLDALAAPFPFPVPVPVPVPCPLSPFPLSPIPCPLSHFPIPIPVPSLFRLDSLPATPVENRSQPLPIDITCPLHLGLLLRVLESKIAGQSPKSRARVKIAGQSQTTWAEGSRAWGRAREASTARFCAMGNGGDGAECGCGGGLGGLGGGVCVGGSRFLFQHTKKKIKNKIKTKA